MYCAAEVSGMKHTCNQMSSLQHPPPALPIQIDSAAELVPTWPCRSPFPSLGCLHPTFLPSLTASPSCLCLCICLPGLTPQQSSSNISPAASPTSCSGKLVDVVLDFSKALGLSLTASFWTKCPAHSWRSP